MIPAPPADPALGERLARALEGDEVATVLSGLFANLTTCTPRYIRYKPGTSALVQYEVRLDGIDTLAHAWITAGRDAELAFERPSFQRLLGRARRRREGPEIRAAYLPQLGALFQVFPVDRSLPGLVRAASARKVSRLLGRTVGGLRLIRYKPGRKALLRYATEGECVYGKIYVRDARARAVTSAAVAEAGIRSPRPLVFLPEIGGVIFEEARGRRLADFRGSQRFTAGLPAAAGALAGLHAASVPGLRRADESRRLLEAARLLGAIVPERGEAIGRVAASLAPELAASDAGAAIHGDFYDDQVLVDGHAVTLLDFDEARLGDPLRDVGNALAHIARDGDEHARSAFLDAYTSLRPVDERRLMVFEAAALLELAIGPFRRLEPRWPEDVCRLVELAEHRFSEHCGLRVARVTDTATIGRKVETALAGATVVRHKPGRRCTVRYDVDGGGRLWGKAYASRRGPDVYARLARVAAATREDPRVRVPEPVAYLPELQLLLLREVEGEAATPLLLAGDETLAEHIAEALFALHACRAQLGREHALPDELEPLAGRVERIAGARPALARAARHCLALAQQPPTATWRYRTVHRDFYDEQVLVSPAGIAFVDLDDSAESEPALDVANFLAHLRLLGAPPAVGDCFWARYRALDPALDDRLVRFLQATTLLRLADIHLGRNGEGPSRELLGAARDFLEEIC